MRFVPAQVHVRRGDRLVVELTNVDTTTHDLVIGQIEQRADRAREPRSNWTPA